MVKRCKSFETTAAALVCLFSFLVSAFMPSCFLAAQARVNVPDAVLKKPVAVVEDSVSTYVPSSCAPGNGIAVNIIYPEKPRYKAGAPIAIVVNGNESNSLSMSMHAANCGIAEVRFAYPGKGMSRFHSDGIFDNFGDNCSTALKDVILFMKGEANDYKGRSVRELIPVSLDQSVVGLVAWETGANIALVTMAKHHKKIPFINYIAFFEGAAGSMFLPSNLGTVRDMFLNRHYKEGSAATGKILVDYRKLMYAPDARLHPGVAKKRGEAEITGVLYFDENNNGAWDESSEYALNHATEVGLDKHIYAPPITEALVRHNVFNRSYGNPEARALKEKLSEQGPMKKQPVKKAEPSLFSKLNSSITPKKTEEKGKEEKQKDNKSKEGRKKKEKASDEKNKDEKNKDGKAETPKAEAPKPESPKEAKKRLAHQMIVRLKDFDIDNLKEFEENIAYTAAYNRSLKERLKDSTRFKEDFAEHKKDSVLEILQWSPTVAVPSVSKAYFEARDGSLYVKDVCQNYPNLLVGLFGARVAHTQRQPDHPHIAMLYNQFLENKPKWLRLNGEPVYISTICKMNINNFSANEPNSSLDATNIVDHLAPLGLVPEYAYMDALVAELSDRAKSGNLRSPLPVTLSDYTPIADPKKETKPATPDQTKEGGSVKKEAANQ
jgi:hypothetical protein